MTGKSRLAGTLRFLELPVMPYTNVCIETMIDVYHRNEHG